MAMTTTETMVIDILRQEGEQTLESLWHRSGLDWVQVFGAIDHLSRSGEVSLRRATAALAPSPEQPRPAPLSATAWLAAAKSPSFSG